MINLDTVPLETTAFPASNPMGCAIGFLAVLAFPETQSGTFKNRNEFVDAAVAYLLRRCKWSGRPIPNAPEKRAKKPVQQIEGRFDKATARLRDRDLAAEFVLWRMARHSDSVTILGRRPSTNSVAEWLSWRLQTGMIDISDRKRAVMRKVSASLPVIHLAVALRGHLLKLGKTVSVQDLIESPDWVIPAIEKAGSVRTNLLPLALERPPEYFAHFVLEN